MIIKKNLLGKELSFEMTNRTYLNLDDKYGNAGAIVNSVCYGVKAYDDENKNLLILVKMDSSITH